MKPTAGTQAAEAAQRVPEAPVLQEATVMFVLVTAVVQAEVAATEEVLQAAMTAAPAHPAPRVVITLQVPEAAQAAHKVILPVQVRQESTAVVAEPAVGIREMMVL
jgi:hypothetical protein